MDNMDEVADRWYGGECDEPQGEDRSNWLPRMTPPILTPEQLKQRREEYARSSERFKARVRGDIV